MIKMENPWKHFEISKEMVHESDREAFEIHNARAKKPNHRLLMQLAPEPWIGSPQAKVVILYANPGATDGDQEGRKQECADRINELSIANLRGQINDYPHFFFNEELKESAGYKWYAKRFRLLIEGSSVEEVSKGIMTCELAPYHSVNWRKPSNDFATQKYTFEIVRQAVEDEKVILIIRGKDTWLENVPGLQKYLENGKAFLPSSRQCGYITRNNLGEGFDAALKAIRNGR